MDKKYITGIFIIVLIFVFIILFPPNNLLLGLVNYISENYFNIFLIDYNSPHKDQWYLNKFENTKNYNFDVVCNDKKIYNMKYWYTDMNSDITIIYFPGYKTTRAYSFGVNRSRIIPIMLDVNFASCDYRGTADINGTYTEDNMLEDSYNYIKYIIMTHKPKNIILYGFSISCNIVIGLNRLINDNSTISGIILEAPILSFSDNSSLLNSYYSNLLKYNYKFISNKQYLLDINCPIFILHSTHDPISLSINSVQLTENLVELNKKVYLNIVKKYGHNNLLKSYEIIEKMKMFINVLI